jgi:glycerol-3-phosphate O-acyltransferase/dihydroxyacetone phosphate acyltransferase
VKRRLLEYYSLLQSTQLSHAVLASLPLPALLDPARPTPVPGRLRTLAVLARDTLSALVALPFFVLPLLLHAPAYALGRVGARLVEHEEETQAQNKVVFGLLFLVMCYPAAFFAVWAFLWYSRVGALIAGGLVALLAVYHTQGVNGAFFFSPPSPRPPRG